MSTTIDLIDYDRIKTLLQNPFALNQQLGLMLIKSINTPIEDRVLKLLMTNSIDKLKWCIEYKLIDKIKIIALKNVWIDARIIGQCVDVEYLYLTDQTYWGCFEHAFAQLSKLKTLSLAKNKLAKFPVSIFKLKNLKRLYLNGNHLLKLPASIMLSQKLEYLNLANNRLKNLPTQITSLRELQVLNLSGNYLTKLPDSIGCLTNLRKLMLSNNKLQIIPLSIMRAKQLETLYLYQNPVCKNSKLMEELQTCLPNTDIRF